MAATGHKAAFGSLDVKCGNRCTTDLPCTWPIVSNSAHSSRSSDPPNQLSCRHPKRLAHSDELDDIELTLAVLVL